MTCGSPLRGGRALQSALPPRPAWLVWERNDAFLGPELPGTSRLFFPARLWSSDVWYHYHGQAGCMVLGAEAGLKWQLWRLWTSSLYTELTWDGYNSKAWTPPLEILI